MKKSWLFFIPLLLLISCKKQSSPEDNTVTVNVKFTNFTGVSAVNRSYVISTARLYLSNFELVESNGTNTVLKDLILANSENLPSQNSFTFDMPAGTYTKFRYHFGLDSVTNNSVDPSAFDASHPLSLNQDMFWGMMRYRFIVAEGHVDSSGAKNQTPANPFSMHLGTDVLYREINANLSSSKIKQVDITIDLKSLMVLDENNFDITNFSNHSAVSEMPKAILITNNFVNSIQTTITYK